ncbi:hypothetical protein MHBO_002468, partial [Bonamia ostreae]
MSNFYPNRMVPNYPNQYPQNSFSGNNNFPNQFGARYPPQMPFMPSEPFSSAKNPLSAVLTKFIATHKDVCRVGVFSKDGTLAATGSSDTSIKLLDVSKMHFHNQ